MNKYPFLKLMHKKISTQTICLNVKQVFPIENEDLIFSIKNFDNKISIQDMGMH